MLRELHISNLAVIADAKIVLASGLNCFTGATGAGKSLVIGALELLLGMRAPAEMLRPGVEEGRVSGIFHVSHPETLQAIEALSDIPLGDDDGELLLSRRIYSSGRSSISLNGQPLTLSMLRQLAEHLVDVHGQHDHQFLLKPSNQLQVLDQYADLEPLRTRYSTIHGQLREARQKLDELTTGQTLRAQQLELYRFQADEIDAANLDAAEFETLQARASMLRNLEKLKKDAGAVHEALYDMDGSILERLKMMSSILAELSLLDGQVSGISSAVRDSTLQLEESAFDLSRYLDRLDLDPAEIAEIDDRLNLINRILSKYGQSIADVLDYRQRIGQTIAQLLRDTEDLSALTGAISKLANQLQALGHELSAARQAAAAKLGPLVQKQLADLGMEKATFSISFEPASSERERVMESALGMDVVEFVAQTNPGQLALPLRKIASGGELSRIMLALKGILAASDRISVLVFDEIDANVGGRLGSTIGNRLRLLARTHQVLCITHLPQIASYADRHLTVRKQIVDNSTVTTVRVMEGDERIEELAEMTGGQKITPTTRAQARELLENAQIDSAAPPPPVKRSTKPVRSSPSNAPTKPATKPAKGRPKRR